MTAHIILDTDIGTDIDDAYALILAAMSPELSLRAVTVVNNNVEVRAAIAKVLLRQMGRDDVPVALGSAPSLTPGITRGWMGHEGQGIDLSGVIASRDLDPRPASRLIAEEAERAAGLGHPLTLVTIGALTNVAIALRDYPVTARSVARIISMASSFEGYGKENARGEHNVACDPVAFQEVINSGIPISIVGLNVTTLTSMSADDLDRIEAIGGPLAESLAAMHRIWFTRIGRTRSSMHDAVAVAASFNESILTWTSVAGGSDSRSEAPGAVVYNPRPEEQVTRGDGARKGTRIATGLDVEAFHTLLFDRIEGAIRRFRGSE